jgi:transcriptional regulator with XRE-family HTH domain
MSIIDLAKKMGKTKQAISLWELGNIPKDRVEELSLFFGIPQEYFGEITDVQASEIDQLILKNINIESEYIDNKDDTDVEISDYTDKQMSIKKLIKEIESIIDSSSPGRSLSADIERIDIYIKMFSRFSNVAMKYELRGLLFQVIRAFELSFNIRRDSIWGSGDPQDGLVSDDDPLVKELKNIFQRKDIQDQIEKSKELLEL